MILTRHSTYVATASHHFLHALNLTKKKKNNTELCGNKFGNRIDSLKANTASQTVGCE